tara:strand:- start:827 stop:1807 length:981 start_codon:yes stop_codon:yes gene_type:complete
MEKISEAIQFYRYVGFGNKNSLRLLNAKNFSIFSSPRGGSTWLAQTLNKMPNSALVWEPLFKYNKYKINLLNPFAYPERHQVDIGWNQFIPHNADWSEAKVFFTKLFNREIVNLKLYRFNDLSQLPNAESFIFKFCFGNNLLPWLVENFTINPVFLMRHPCAVIASQLNFKSFDWHKDNVKYDYNMHVYADEFYAPYRDVLESINTVEERLAAEWAMNILTPVNSVQNDLKWVTLSYEHLVNEPESALKKIFTRYEIEQPDNLLNQMDETSFTKSSFGNKGISERLSSWRSVLSPKQIRLILDFTERMGVDFYSDALEPDYGKIYK